MPYPIPSIRALRALVYPFNVARPKPLAQIPLYAQGNQ